MYLPYARMAHFGHLLTEFAGNAGPLFEHPQGLDGIGGKHSLLVVPARFHASVTALTNLLRLPSGRVISAAALSAPAWADEAIIIRPSMINRHGVARHHFTHVRHVLARIHRIGVGLKTFSANVGSDKVYLSRSRLSPGMRKVRAEDELASELERLGWRVVHPQELTLSRQLEILAAAHTVAGCIGSALHLLMAFGSWAAGRRLITLGEGVEQTNPNIVLQANRQGMQFRHVLCMTKDAMDGDGGLAAETFRFTA